ncbi:MAG TPA: hypothetical protein DCE42_30585 [Myxococcales bacterium]|nr:hypothetical protein [Deltaproteobacteria bacterium]HAA59136.1 hypothetical protein [Myxococcales bacterium]
MFCGLILTLTTSESTVYVLDKDVSLVNKRGFVYAHIQRFLWVVKKETRPSRSPLKRVWK